MSIAANRLRTALVLAVPMLLPFLLLWPFRAAGPVADDFYFARTTFSLHPADLVANRDWRHDLAQNVRGYRPLSTASYAVSQRIGDGGPTAFRATNLVLHGAASSLVGALGVALTGSTGVGLIAGVLFAVHPVHHENVMWISGRTFPLAAIFYLAVLVLIIRSCPRGAASAAHATPIGLLVLGGTLYLASLASYEGAITLPLVLFALVMYLAGDDSREAPWTMAAARAVRTALPYAMLTAVYLTLRWLFVSSASDEAVAYGGQRLARNAMGVVARLLAMPRLGHTPIPSATFYAGAMLAIAAIGGGLLSRPTRRLIVWALAFAVLAYLPFLALPGYSDRFAYLTSAGFVIALAAGLRGWLQGHVASRAAAFAACGLVAALWSAQLVRAAEQWQQAGDVAADFAAQLRHVSPKPPRAARLGFLCVPDFHGTAYIYYTYFEAEMQRVLGRTDVTIARFPRVEDEAAAVQMVTSAPRLDALFRWKDRERQLEAVDLAPDSANHATGPANSPALACQPEPAILKP